MLANYRCSEIREQILKENHLDLHNFTNQSASKVMNTFGIECSKIKKNILDSYDSLASNYDKKVYLNIKNQIMSTLSSKFYLCFSQQIAKMIPIAQKFIRIELQKLLQTNDEFYTNAIELKKKYLNDLVKKLENIKVFDDWVISVEQFSEIFDEVIDNQKKQCLDQKKVQIIVIII
jgi:hypothetical protein